VKLPHSEDAYVPREKLTHYLLSETHPVGKFKARFFRALGFDDNNVQLLERELLQLARQQDVAETKDTTFGTNYTLDGSIAAPADTAVLLRTVWTLDQGSNKPRFVTAYPL